MISIAPASAKKFDETNLHISVELNTKTRFKGFKVEVVELSTTAPYSPLIDSLRGYSDTFFIHKKLLKRSLKQNATYQDPPSFALEIKTLGGNELAGLLTFDLKSTDKLFINGLGIFERFQRNGLGTLLMSHAIEIANFKGIRRVQLESDQQGKIMKPRTRRGLQTDIECSWLPFSAYASNLL
ncbi:GNAT family N-acetyltransferase [Endozoicomonas atrinae]|uniref:GNAT family N-acetyltransferase n=1 Tax=Endozoicomonas atrinae TaxID=1333660 RepID=UPI003AFFF690